MAHPVSGVDLLFLRHDVAAGRSYETGVTSINQFFLTQLTSSILSAVGNSVTIPIPY